MRQRIVGSLAALLVAAGGCASCDRGGPAPAASAGPAKSGVVGGSQASTTEPAMTPSNSQESGAAGKMNLSEAEWRKRLSPQQYDVLREKGTERAFTGKYWDTKTPGVYKCAGCGVVLFTSGDKFDSGCGWPSFDKMAKAGVVQEHVDTSHGMVRTEVTCARCGGHLGHVFDDGPTETHLRYCINSASIELEPSGESKPDAPKK